MLAAENAKGQKGEIEKERIRDGGRKGGGGSA